MKMKDWIEKEVRLKRDIKTRGGKLFTKGTIMRAYSHWRGRLSLETIEGNLCISHVNKCDIELVNP